MSEHEEYMPFFYKFNQISNRIEPTKTLIKIHNEVNDKNHQPRNYKEKKQKDISKKNKSI